MALTNKMSDECDLDVYRFNECVYYLRTYGNHSTLIAFYVRHGCWMEAARYILDNVSAAGCGVSVIFTHIYYLLNLSHLCRDAQQICLLTTFGFLLLRWAR